MRHLLDKTLKIDHRRELPKYSFGTFRGSDFLQLHLYLARALDSAG
ncbi:hypothetical protein [Xenorhabdus japonica]